MDWFRKHYAIWGSVVFVGLLALGGWFFGSRRAKHRNENGPGEIGHVGVVTFADGRLGFLLSESIDHSDEDSNWSVWRLSSLAIADGTLRARVVLPASLRCEAASPGLAWCEGTTYVGKDVNLELRNVDTLTVAADAAKLRASGPDLAGWISNDTPSVDESGTIYVTTKQGHAVAIDPKTLASKRATAPASDRTRMVGTTPPQGLYPTNEKIERISTVNEPNGRRQRLVIGTPSRPLGDRSFLSPTIAARLTDSKLVVVVHKSSLDDKQSRLLFTGLTETGETLWDLEDAQGAPVTTGYAKDANVIAFVIGAPSNYVIGIDLKTGARRYRYDGTRPK